MAISTVKAVINGTTTTLLLNTQTGLYEANLTAPSETSYNNNSGHYYPVVIQATDDAGNTTTISDSNETFGDFLKLRVKETTAPVITITNPTEGQMTGNKNPTVNWTITDSGAGVNPDTIGITIDNGSKITNGITKTPITNGYQCSYSIGDSLSDGAHTIYVDGSDYDDNKATQRTVNFTVDTVPPQLSVKSPTNNYVTNKNTVVVSGSASDIATGLSKITVKVNVGTEKEISFDENGNFNTEITLQEGANTIVVTATDNGGMSSSVTRIVTLDTGAPVISAISINPNPVSTGEILTVTVNVSD